MDLIYIVLVLPAVFFSLWASIKVNTTFKKYSSVRTAKGMTGAEAAREVLDRKSVV